MQIEPIGKAYTAELAGDGHHLTGGTDCGGHTRLLVTNGSNISVCIWIYSGDGAAYTAANTKNIVIPRYGMMILQKKTFMILMLNL